MCGHWAWARAPLVVPRIDLRRPASKSKVSTNPISNEIQPFSPYIPFFQLSSTTRARIPALDIITNDDRPFHTPTAHKRVTACTAASDSWMVGSWERSPTIKKLSMYLPIHTSLRLCSSGRLPRGLVSMAHARIWSSR